MSLSAAKLKVRQFLAGRYPADLGEHLAMYSREVVKIDVLAGDLDGEVHWDLADLTGDPDLSSRASIRFDCSRLREACSVVSESVPSSVADMLQLTI